MPPNPIYMGEDPAPRKASSSAGNETWGWSRKKNPHISVSFNQPICRQKTRQYQPICDGQSRDLSTIAEDQQYVTGISSDSVKVGPPWQQLAPDLFACAMR